MCLRLGKGRCGRGLKAADGWRATGKIFPLVSAVASFFRRPDCCSTTACGPSASLPPSLPLSLQCVCVCVYACFFSSFTANRLLVTRRTELNHPCMSVCVFVSSTLSHTHTHRNGHERSRQLRLQISRVAPPTSLLKVCESEPAGLARCDITPSTQVRLKQVRQ